MSIADPPIPTRCRSCGVVSLGACPHCGRGKLLRLYLYDPSQSEPDDPETWARRCGFSSHAELAKACNEQDGAK